MGLVVMNALGAAAAVHAQFQQSTKPSPPLNSSPPSMPDVSGRQAEPDNPMSERMKISAERAHNEERRKRMLSDTEKLLSLSTELKEYLEKTTRDELSLDVIRKAGEIERLAHDVQQRMKN